MKILGIIGSARPESISTRILREMLAVFEGEGWEAVTFEVNQNNIHDCNACDACRKTGYCVFRDDFDKITGDLLSADAIILASPIHFYALPAPVKRFIDRCQPFWSRRHHLKDQELLSRKPCQFVFIAAAGGPDLPKLLTASRLTLTMWCNTMGYTYGSELLIPKTDKITEASLQNLLAEARAVAGKLSKGDAIPESPGEPTRPEGKRPLWLSLRASFMALCGIMDKQLPVSEVKLSDFDKNGVPATGPVVIYKASPGAELQGLLTVLRQSDITPQVLDQAMPTMMYASGWSYRVSVAVSPDEVPAAVAAINAWTRNTAGEAEVLHRIFMRQATVALLSAFIPASLILLIADNPSRVPWGILFMTWLAIIFLISGIKQLRDR